MRDGDYHIIICIHVFRVELSCHRNNPRAALIAIFLLHFQQLLLDKVVTQAFAAKQLIQVSNQRLQIGILFAQLFDTQTRQLAQTHIHDGLTLQIVQTKTLLQIRLSIRRCMTGTDDMYHLIYIINRNNQALQDMRTLFCFTQLETRTAGYHVHTVLYKIANQVFQIKQTRSSLNQRNIIHAEAALKSGIFI